MKYRIGDMVKTIHPDTTKVETGIIVETHGAGYYRIKFFNYPNLSWYFDEEIKPA
jgi:hypothetical protein